MNAATHDLFERYRENAQGHLVPIESIDALDLEKDELVKDIIAKALVLQASIREFKARTQADMLAFLAHTFGMKVAAP
jgi:hypothetical protein